MADRDIPQFENYPEIYAQIRHSGGILYTTETDPVTGADPPDEITLLVEGDQNDWQLPCELLDHTDGANARIINGTSVPCNVRAEIPAGFSDEIDAFNCKWEIVHDANSDPPRVSYAPTTGVKTIAITANVRGADGLPAGSGSGA